jgi:Na+/H+-dicarboxylate symporter/ABC-type amino acid transport substrate-binding protein
VTTLFKKIFGLSLSTKVLLGFALGIFSGVFFGEMMAFLKLPGDAFIQLLQMTVLPYIILSLITGLGGLNYNEAISLAKKGGLLLIILWAVVIATILVIPLAYPDWKTASFFSTTLIKETEEFDFLSLYIPANPFFSMASNTVPAVVLFSIALGVALIGIKNKKSLIDNCAIITDALGRVTGFVVNLAPIGIFAIAASATGTMETGEFGRLQVYLVTYLAAWVVVTFWTLPALVTSLTPLKYREIVGESRGVLVTAFAIGNLFIVLPLLSERCKELLSKYQPSREESDSVVDVIVPTSFSIPNVGKLLTLSFVLFAGWFSSSSVSVSEYPTFVLTGLFSFFGHVTVAIPFLLDLLHIPDDVFQLFMVSDVVISRFGTLLAAMHILVLTLLTTFTIQGRLTIRWTKLVRYAAVTIALTLSAILGTRFFFNLFEPSYTRDQSFVGMNLMNEPVPMTIHTEPPPLPPAYNVQESLLDKINERGILRVGYFKDALPYAFLNNENKLVGFDIEMANLLAKELGVTIDFVRIDHEKMIEQLNAGSCDIIMSGVFITTNKAQKMAFSAPYMDNTLAFIVKDYRRDEFNSRKAVQKLKSPRIGMSNVPYYIAKVRDYLPQAQLVALSSPREFLRGKRDDLDAFAYSAEAGSAWTLVYPNYTVAVPIPDIMKIPLAYPIAFGNQKMLDFLNTWIELKKKDETIEKIYDYWILGQGAGRKEPRWSIIRNVLHWVE